jgi:hypothetical protein
VAELPLPSGGETGTTTTPQAGACHLRYYLLGGHIKENFPQRLIASGSEVILDHLRVNVATIAKDNTLLSFIEGDVIIVRHRLAAHRIPIEEALHRFVLQKVSLNNSRYILHLHLGIENAFRFNINDRAPLTEAVTTRWLDFNLSLQPRSLHFLL